MKKLMTLILFFIAVNLNAGGYYNIKEQGYDSETSLFYYSVKHKPESGGLFSSESNTRVKNILIFDPKTEKQWYLFKPNTIWNIRHFTFESYKDEGKKINFYAGGYNVMNSVDLIRELKNKLLIITSEEKNDKLTMWFASKTGENLKQVHMFNKTDKWHIDIKNSKIRFITHKNEILIKSIDW